MQSGNNVHGEEVCILKADGNTRRSDLLFWSFLEQAHPQEAGRPAVGPFGQQRALHTLQGLSEAAEARAALLGLILAPFNPNLDSVRIWRK